MLPAGLSAALLALVPALALALPLYASRAEDFSDQELAEGFEWTVFGLEYRAWSWQPYLVKKFMQPVRFHIVNTARRDRSAEARGFIDGLSERIRGLDAGLAPSEETSNFQLYIVDRADYEATVREKIYDDKTSPAAGRCLVRVYTASSGISRSTAVIVGDEGDHLFRRCLVEEILQGLGPMNDDDRLIHSVFNDLSDHDTFTRFDQLLMNMLYDPRIRPGMNAKKVKPLLPGVIRDARRVVR